MLKKKFKKLGVYSSLCRLEESPFWDRLKGKKILLKLIKVHLKNQKNQSSVLETNQVFFQLKKQTN